MLYPCSACGEDKPAAAFSFADVARRLLNSYCRACHAAYRHAHYLANKPDYVRRATAQVAARRIENRRRVLDYLATHPCVDCGMVDRRVLEFDHRDPAQKLDHVGTLIMGKRWAARSRGDREVRRSLRQLPSSKDRARLWVAQAQGIF